VLFGFLADFWIFTIIEISASEKRNMRIIEPVSSAHGVASNGFTIE
jgi:hypothetical protein